MKNIFIVFLNLFSGVENEIVVNANVNFCTAHECLMGECKSQFNSNTIRVCNVNRAILAGKSSEAIVNCDCMHKAVRPGPARLGGPLIFASSHLVPLYYPEYKPSFNNTIGVSLNGSRCRPLPFGGNWQHLPSVVAVELPTDHSIV